MVGTPIALDIAASVLMAGSFGYAVHKIRSSKKRFDEKATNFLNTLDEFRKMNDLEEFDVVVKDCCLYRDEIEQANKDTIVSMDFVGGELKKGYDLVHAVVKAGFKTPFHKHNEADEFLYLINGELEVIDHTMGKVERTNLESGDHIFLAHDQFHCVHATKNSSMIIIARPPLITCE